MIFLTKAISSSSTRIPMGRSATTNKQTHQLTIPKKNKNLTTRHCIQNHSNKTINKESHFKITKHAATHILYRTMKTRRHSSISPTITPATTPLTP